MKRIVLSIAVGLVLGCSKNIGFLSLSDEINRIYGGKNDHSTFKLTKLGQAARIAAYRHKDADFLRANLDTVFICEGYHMESGVYYGSIFNNGKRFNYEFHKGALKSTASPFFSDKMLRLVAQWDTVQIRTREGGQNKYLGDEVIVTGIRAYKKDTGWVFDKINFKDISSF